MTVKYRATSHNIQVRYGPKVDGVMSGRIRQTIRRANPSRPKRVGDRIILHTWSGRPYRSPWGWRRVETIKSVTRIYVSYDFLLLSRWVGLGGQRIPWNHPLVHDLAERDGIDPPTGEELRDVLAAYNPEILKGETVPMDIIRW